MTPKAGYTFTGVVEKFFTVAGATTTNNAASGIITAVFPSTEAAPKEITNFTPLMAVTLSGDEYLVDLAALKASSKLPTKVTVTDGETPVDATITDWIGTFDGTIGAKTITAVWTMPVGYADEIEPISVTLTINVNTAQTIDSTEQDNLDIALAKSAIESATYTATQAEAENETNAKTKAQALVDSLGEDLKGTVAIVVAGTFNAAVAGTAEDSDGTNGSYTFTVKINKGGGIEAISGQQTMTITATAYVASSEKAIAETTIGTLDGTNIKDVPAGT